MERVMIDIESKALQHIIAQDFFEHFLHCAEGTKLEYLPKFKCMPANRLNAILRNLKAPVQKEKLLSKLSDEWRCSYTIEPLLYKNIREHKLTLGLRYDEGEGWEQFRKLPFDPDQYKDFLDECERRGLYTTALSFKYDDRDSLTALIYGYSKEDCVKMARKIKETFKPFIKKWKNK